MEGLVPDHLANWLHLFLLLQHNLHLETKRNHIEINWMFSIECKLKGMSFVPWPAMEAANCMNGLGDELPGGENANGPCWAGNSDSLPRFKRSGATDSPVRWTHSFTLATVLNRLDLKYHNGYENFYTDFKVTVNIIGFTLSHANQNWTTAWFLLILLTSKSSWAVWRIVTGWNFMLPLLLHP